MAQPYKGGVYYVYMIQSIRYPSRYYVGFTTKLKERIATHNVGQNKSTAASKPWKIIGYIAFEEKKRALDFESYLKTSSGKAFARKRLWRGEE